VWSLDQSPHTPPSAYNVAVVLSPARMKAAFWQATRFEGTALVRRKVMGRRRSESNIFAVCHVPLR
jgi:hypothetical protein